MDWHITALDLGVRQKRGSKPNYLGNRASLIAFSICGTASGQNRFATSRSIAASATLHKTATVSGSIFTPFVNLKYTGEASLARFSRDSYCSVENSISGFTTRLIIRSDNRCLSDRRQFRVKGTRPNQLPERQTRRNYSQELCRKPGIGPRSAGPNFGARF